MGWIICQSHGRLKVWNRINRRCPKGKSWHRAGRLLLEVDHVRDARGVCLSRSSDCEPGLPTVPSVDRTDGTGSESPQGEVVVLRVTFGADCGNPRRMAAAALVRRNHASASLIMTSRSTPGGAW